MPKPRILFVEDEDYIARVIKSSLEDAGYEVFRANSLVQGRVEAATRSPELLILDLGLPDGDGTDLIRTLRSYSSVPIIILSARSGDDAKVDVHIEYPGMVFLQVGDRITAVSQVMPDIQTHTDTGV